MTIIRNEINNCPLCRTENNSKFVGYRLHGSQKLFPARNYEQSEKVYCCKTCNLYYNNPQVIFREGVFDRDDSLMRLTNENVATIKSDMGYYEDTLDFLKRKGLRPGAKALDIGCGIGRAAYKLIKAGYETYAIEPKKELLDFAIENAFIDGARAFNTHFDAIDFEEASFDFIFLEPLNHLPDPDAAIQRALKWLKPGGYLHLEVVNSQWLYKNLISFFYKITFRKHSPYTAPLRKPFNACEYSAKSFRVYAGKMKGLEIGSLSSYACDTYISNRLIDKGISWYMRQFNKGMELTVILKKE